MQDATARRWTNVDKSRYYQATVQPDLFGGWVVMRFWGQLGSRLGGQLFEPVADFPTGELALSRLSELRERRGYRPVPTLSFPSVGTSPQEPAASAAATLHGDGANGRP